MGIVFLVFLMGIVPILLEIVVSFKIECNKWIIILLAGRLTSDITVGRVSYIHERIAYDTEQVPPSDPRSSAARNLPTLGFELLGKNVEFLEIKG
jgi:hypothetical protein